MKLGIITIGLFYCCTGLWIDATVQKEIRWQQFELETLTRQQFELVVYKQETTERQTLIQELKSWLGLPLWERLKIDPPHSKYCNYVEKKQ